MLLSRIRSGEAWQVISWETWYSLLYCTSCPSHKSVRKVGGMASKMLTSTVPGTGFYKYTCSVAKLCPTLCNPTDCSTPGSSVLHSLLEVAYSHVH